MPIRLKYFRNYFLNSNEIKQAYDYQHKLLCNRKASCLALVCVPCNLVPGTSDTFPLSHCALVTMSCFVLLVLFCLLILLNNIRHIPVSGPLHLLSLWPRRVFLQRSICFFVASSERSLISYLIMVSLLFILLSSIVLNLTLPCAVCILAYFLFLILSPVEYKLCEERDFVYIVYF